MPVRMVLLDTSFVLALENRADPHHERAKSLDRDLSDEGAVLVLHWGIILEIGDGYARASRRAKGLHLERFEQEEGYEVHSLTEPLFRDALTLYRAREDKEWGLTCLSKMNVSRERFLEPLLPHERKRDAIRALLLDALGEGKSPAPHRGNPPDCGRRVLI